MAMAGPFEATSHHQFQATFYIHHQTFNIIIATTPILGAPSSAHYSFITHRHKIYAFTLPALLGLLQIQSAGNTTASPFQDHPVTTSASVCGILGYYLAFMAWLCFPEYAAQLSIAMAVFGLFSLASLVTLLLPDSWWHIKYISYFLFSMVELHKVVNVRGLVLTIGRLWPQNSPMHLLPLNARGCNVVE